MRRTVGVVEKSGRGAVVMAEWPAEESLATDWCDGRGLRVQLPPWPGCRDGDRQVAQSLVGPVLIEEANVRWPATSPSSRDWYRQCAIQETSPHVLDLGRELLDRLILRIFQETWKSEFESDKV